MEGPYGSRINRLLAYVIDSWLIFGSQMLGAKWGQSWIPSETGMLAGFIGSGGLAVFFNYGMLQGVTGASIGKTLMGLQVAQLDGSPIGIFRSLYRTSLYLVSAIPAYFGFLAAIRDPNRLCWHDRIAGTVVIRKGTRYPVCKSQLSQIQDHTLEKSVSPSRKAA